MNDCVQRLNDNNFLLVFPEGTRTTPGYPLSFQRGVANIIMRTECLVRPVTITVNPTTLTKSEKWYHIPLKKFKVVIRIGDNLDMLPLALSAPNQTVAARRLTRYLEQYFMKEVEVNG